MPMEGVAAISTTCDHLGILARSPRDAWYFASALLTARAEMVTARRPRRLLALRLPEEIPQGCAYPDRVAALAAELYREGVATELIDRPFPVAEFRSRSRSGARMRACRSDSDCVR